MEDRKPTRLHVYSVEVNLGYGIPIIHFTINALTKEKAREKSVQLFGVMQPNPRDYIVEFKEH